jgi:hypothetical protein
VEITLIHFRQKFVGNAEALYKDAFSLSIDLPSHSRLRTSDTSTRKQYKGKDEGEEIDRRHNGTAVNNPFRGLSILSALPFHIAQGIIQGLRVNA